MEMIDSKQMVDREASSSLSSESNRPIQLVVGLDFGTSFSKVVVGEQRVRYAVPFDDYATGANPLLLPSALCVLPDTGECLLGVERRGGNVYDNLKMPFIERDFSEDVQVRAAAFLALALRHTRMWLFDTHGSIYQDRKIEWFINVGLPTDSYDDEQLTSAYRGIVRAAWGISMLEGDVTLPEALEFLKQSDFHSGRLQQEATAPELYLPHDRIHAFPEFSAQLAGYIRSPRRRDGLHITVDVGGGTLDVTVFNVHQINGEDLYPIFARQVKPLGVRYLTAARLHALNKETDQGHSPFDDLPSNAAFMKRFGMTKDQLESVDQPFQKCVARTVGRVLNYTMQHRYPKAPHWDVTSLNYGEPLPSFFCGGGAFADFYVDLLRGFEERQPPYKVRASQLPVPDDLVPSMLQKDYARLAVAYGLSFDPFDIGQIRQMNQVEDVPTETPQSIHERRYIGKEQT